MTEFLFDVPASTIRTRRPDLSAMNRAATSGNPSGYRLDDLDLAAQHLSDESDAEGHVGPRRARCFRACAL